MGRISSSTGIVIDLAEHRKRRNWDGCQTLNQCRQPNLIVKRL